MIVGNRLEMIDVVKKYVWKAIGLGIDVPGYGQIDQQQWPRGSGLEQPFQAWAVQDVVGGACAADHNVDPMELGFPVVKPDGAPAQFRRQHGRSIE